MNRLSWDTYFISLAKMVSSRATCKRKKVGCVFVRDRAILSTGYNGSIAHTPHCLDEGCLIEDNHCIRTIHAEANAIAQAAKNGISLKDSTIYCTCKPCWTCFKQLLNVGVKEIVYDEEYPSRLVEQHKSLVKMRKIL